MILIGEPAQSGNRIDFQRTVGKQLFRLVDTDVDDKLFWRDMIMSGKHFAEINFADIALLRKKSICQIWILKVALQILYGGKNGAARRILLRQTMYHMIKNAQHFSLVVFKQKQRLNFLKIFEIDIGVLNAERNNGIA